MKYLIGHFTPKGENIFGVETYFAKDAFTCIDYAMKKYGAYLMEIHTTTGDANKTLKSIWENPVQPLEDWIYEK